LKTNFPQLSKNIIDADILKFDLNSFADNEQFAIIGNFPYNISTQIVFKLIEFRNNIPEFTGMFQKEVANRICVSEGVKAYGILSVLVQAFYDAEYLFTVPPNVFDPPPKVDSGVIRLTRKNNYSLQCDEKLFFKVVKTSFQQRRKTLRNSLKAFDLSHNLKANTIFDKRPEQLTVNSFINLVNMIERDKLKI
ncbi:MAG: 16S rRNA (adenine(1518)-N(6)/adenine(1519)-N(6))-dimethyltransferase RsmA, partial [Flavobacteriales bacterium]|nr:16S rRNA (adenine(1518)-N(6)/adenine(1519)-N(6))-dimethyltransferase RsmA [Flavobacteriales bacterium]